MTDPDTDDLRHRLGAWTVAPPGEAAKARMIAAAMSGRQEWPWRRFVAREVEYCLTDWRYGLAYKAAAAAACLLLGLGASFIAAPPVSVARVALIANLEDPS